MCTGRQLEWVKKDLIEAKAFDQIDRNERQAVKKFEMRLRG